MKIGHFISLQILHMEDDLVLFFFFGTGNDVSWACSSWLPDLFVPAICPFLDYSGLDRAPAESQTGLNGSLLKLAEGRGMSFSSPFVKNRLSLLSALQAQGLTVDSKQTANNVSFPATSFRRCSKPLSCHQPQMTKPTTANLADFVFLGMSHSAAKVCI